MSGPLNLEDSLMLHQDALRVIRRSIPSQRPRSFISIV